MKTNPVLLRSPSLGSCSARPHCLRSTPLRSGQRGFTLVMVMMILIVVSLLGVGAAQIGLMSERGARNDRDQLLAMQSAEAGLIDASMEIDPVVNSASSRRNLFDGKSMVAFPSSGCGTSGTTQGLCAAPPTATSNTSADYPLWAAVDFTNSSATAPTTAFGAYTGKTFQAGGVGVQPAKAPRYVIEPITVSTGDPSNPDIVYRVTAIGFGPRADIQTVLQMQYRI